MSQPLFRDDILFLQRFLRASGFDPGPLDGIWGPRTDAAWRAFSKRTDEIASELGTFDAISERNIRTLQPRAQIAARNFLRRVRDTGIPPARIISGTRTYAEQNTLYRRGRFGSRASRVTNARGGQSNHNFGRAWDIGIFPGGRYAGSSPLYDQAAAVGLVPGLEWGGHWRTFKDRPHYQLASDLPLAARRRRFESGVLYG